MTKRVEALMRRAEGALGRAFRQLDAAGDIARKLDAESLKDGNHNFVDFMIIREVIERVGRICNAAFIADARAAGPLPFPPPATGVPGAWSLARRPVKEKRPHARPTKKKRR